jgi:hypothetical protein
VARPRPLLRCPSEPLGMGDVPILGVISRDAQAPHLAYLGEPLAPTPEILALAAPPGVDQVFRLSARCEEKKCTHFDGHDCQPAVWIARMLPEAADYLPACNIRPDCWFKQEGRAACVRCKQILTATTSEADERWQQVAGVPPRGA